jgi:recombination protein RecR
MIAEFGMATPSEASMHKEQNGTGAVTDKGAPARTRKQEKAGEQDAKVSGRALGRMVEAFMRLPGIGRKSAERLAFAVLGMQKDEAAGIAQAILDLKDSSRYCPLCNNITEDELCSICSDARRDPSVICVVEEPSNILVLEKTGMFRGRYHALLGALSPLDGIGPEDLKIDGLLDRLRAGGVTEVILATNPTVKGEATALYLARLIKPLGIGVSRIAYGLPVGGDIEYADENTVQRALQGRRAM